MAEETLLRCFKILRWGECLGLSGWTLNVTTSVSVGGKSDLQKKVALRQLKLEKKRPHDVITYEGMGHFLEDETGKETFSPRASIGSNAMISTQ